MLTGKEEPLKPLQKVHTLCITTSKSQEKDSSVGDSFLTIVNRVKLLVIHIDCRTT